MREFLSSSAALTTAAALLAAAIAIACVLIMRSRGKRVPMARRRPGAPSRVGLLTAATNEITAQAGRLVGERNSRLSIRLEGAGIKRPAKEVAVIALSAVVTAAAIGLLLGSPLATFLLPILAALGCYATVSVKASRRRRAFAEQLDETMQMLAGSLRAGYSLLQATATLAEEADVPTRDEFTRIINETRVGRPLNEAIEDAAGRMGNQDFFWVSQAIAINREVGGNLADVLDNVGKTIRDRGKLHRQVNALSAEGRMSAIILLALPFCIVALISLVNPSYLVPMTQSPLGYLLLGIGALLLIVGAVWMRATVKIKY